MEDYEITARGELDPSWSEWFEGMAIRVEQMKDGGSATILRGHVEDQAHLRGILCRLWDLNLELMSIWQVEPENSI